MSAPQTMAARRSRIRAILESRDVASQADLRAILDGEGFAVTQATLSRDLDAIGAVKQPGPDGLLCYRVLAPATVSRLAPTADTVARIAAEVLLDADAAQNIAVLRTPPGAAMYLAGALDRSGMDDLLGTVAGDDTVIVVLRDARAASDLCTTLLGLAERSAAPAVTERRPAQRRTS